MQEYSNPVAGTPLRFSLENIFGATSAADKPYSMRPVENMPPLAEDSAEVSTTKFTKPAAIGMPIRVNMFTNGLWAGFTSLHGVTVIITPSAST